MKLWISVNNDGFQLVVEDNSGIFFFSSQCRRLSFNQDVFPFFFQFWHFFSILDIHFNFDFFFPIQTFQYDFFFNFLNVYARVERQLLRLFYATNFTFANADYLFILETVGNLNIMKYEPVCHF